ncbi:hypothetical protein SMACR_00253 [Sordaria macrospora]|uniref:WGS project CABT00000000 data, contig 2.1 n=2 Tax=Sordaria macrospora TaxID=5147 RepID=F7VKL0_SORMK|nr:uncharacterized protein SMAC_00253 [Sordaria macrospora k-hell]KAA8636826.1 hypothetical protein SMACR_00253 [Sordaria macrospora]WPJ58997.1 hypothetical protein SMAC4_00253 [Sordaria macrospora]CCC06037.1 unnamed protein product [Sordaria macrospora k-hell]
MCKVIMTKYGCGHTIKNYRACENGHDASTGMLGCFSTKAKYCSHPRVEMKTPLLGLCDNCRSEAVKKAGRKPRSESKHKVPLGRSASVKGPPNITLVKGSATGGHEFTQAEPPRGRNKDTSKGKSRESSRHPPLAPRPAPRTALEKGKGRSSSVPPELTLLPATTYNPNGPTIPAPVGSASKYQNRPLPAVPPNSSKSSRIIGGSSGSTSRSNSHSKNGGRPHKGKGREPPAPPVPLSSYSSRPPRGDVNAPIRESQRFLNPGPAPSLPPQHTGREKLPKIIVEELRLEQLDRERRERGRGPVPQQPPPHQPYIKIGYNMPQHQTGQVSHSHSQPHHYPPSASIHMEIHAHVPRRKLSKTRLNEAADHFGSTSRSTSKTRERSASRGRSHGSSKDKKHQKQPSAASSFMTKIKAGLSGWDDEGDDSDSDSSWACQESRAIERGESTLPSRNTSRRTSVHGGPYMHGAMQI